MTGRPSSLSRSWSGATSRSCARLPSGTASAAGRPAWTTSLATPVLISTSTRTSPRPASRACGRPSRPASTCIPRSPSPTPWTARCGWRGPRVRPASFTASCRTSCSCRGSLSFAGALRTASSGACSRCGLSSATGSSRATGSPRSAPPGITVRIRAAESSSTCSRTGSTCWRISSAPSMPCTRCMPLMSRSAGMNAARSTTLRRTTRRTRCWSSPAGRSPPLILPGRCASTAGSSSSCTWADRLAVPAPSWPASHPVPRFRRVYAAPHVAAFPDGTIDWQSTLDFRDHLWAHGFAVAEAMDTAQRGMGLDWDQARDPIAASAGRAGAARREAGLIACGAGTHQLPAGGPHTLTAIARAYEEQLELGQSAGARVILMASRAMAASAQSSGDYLDIYGYLLKQAGQPGILHWLGEAFDPLLRGYWGSTDFDAAADTVVELVSRSAGKVDGIKLSVLDASREVALRRRLPPGVRLYTGDDFNYAH